MLKLPKSRGVCIAGSLNRSDGLNSYCVLNQFYDGATVSPSTTQRLLFGRCGYSVNGFTKRVLLILQLLINCRAKSFKR